MPVTEPLGARGTQMPPIGDKEQAAHDAVARRYEVEAERQANDDPISANVEARRAQVAARRGGSQLFTGRRFPPLLSAGHLLEEPK